MTARRTIPILAATGGALALLANFHTSAASSTVGVTGTATPTSAPAQPAPRTTAPGQSKTPTTAPPTTAAGGTRTVDGPVVANDYGDVQVRVTLNGSKIVDVQALKLPNDRSRSVRISSVAAPRLRTEALQAQSAQIDIVSGATYTSESYARSLQAALDKASR